MKAIYITVGDELYRALRIRLATDGKVMKDIITGLLCGYVGMEFTPIVPEVVDKPMVNEVGHKEPIKRLGIGLIPKDGVVGNKDAKYRTGPCPTHGRMAIGGKWPCCPDA